MKKLISFLNLLTVSIVVGTTQPTYASPCGRPFKNAVRLKGEIQTDIELGSLIRTLRKLSEPILMRLDFAGIGQQSGPVVSTAQLDEAVRVINSQAGPRVFAQDGQAVLFIGHPEAASDLVKKLSDLLGTHGFHARLRRFEALSLLSSAELISELRPNSSALEMLNQSILKNDFKQPINVRINLFVWLNQRYPRRGSNEELRLYRALYSALQSGSLEIDYFSKAAAKVIYSFTEGKLIDQASAALLMDVLDSEDAEVPFPWLKHGDYSFLSSLHRAGVIFVLKYRDEYPMTAGERLNVFMSALRRFPKHEGEEWGFYSTVYAARSNGSLDLKALDPGPLKIYQQKFPDHH